MTNPPEELRLEWEVHLTETYMATVNRDEVSPELWDALTAEPESSIAARVLNLEPPLRNELFGSLRDGIDGLLPEIEATEPSVDPRVAGRALLDISLVAERPAEGSRS